MAIIPVSSVNTTNVGLVAKSAAKVTNLIEKKAQPTVDNKIGSQALFAYFKGGQAVSFKGFDCSTGNFITKQMDDVPCCCCGGKMVLNRNIGTKAREFSALKGQELADKIRDNQDYFRTTQRLIANLIADEAEKHPDYDMGKAIQSF